MTTSIQHPTQLWISDPQTLTTKITEHLQAKLCKNNACTTCTICHQITAQEHPWVKWLSPERSYSLDQIDEVLSITSLKLDDDEQRFFIIQQAERLTDQCSNRLLKTIEEPFPGYNFFFLTNRPQALPLTIKSRCVVQKFKIQTNFEIYKDFLHPLINLKFTDPIGFIKKLDALEIKEQESKELADDLFEYWSNILKEEIQSGQTPSSINKNMVEALQQAIQNPPMTGSSKIFWKNLYITAHNATKNKI